MYKLLSVYQAFLLWPFEQKARQANACIQVRARVLSGLASICGFLPSLGLVQSLHFFAAWVMHLSSVIIIITMVLTAL